MSTVTETLKNPTTRWKFIVMVLAAAVICLLVRYLAFPPQLDSDVSPWGNFSARSLEAASIALMTGLVIHALALWLGPDHRSISLIRILDRSVETTPVFEKAFKTTRTCWYFKGGFGSYFRSKTLPALLKDNKTGLEIMIAVINFHNQDLVEQYAAYRKQASGDNTINADKVREEIKETILTLAKATKSNLGAFSSVNVALLDSYSPFRLDFYDHGAILTQDNKKAPSIEFGPDSTYYQGFKQELVQLKMKSVDLLGLCKTIDLNNELDKLFESIRCGNK